MRFFSILTLITLYLAMAGSAPAAITVEPEGVYHPAAATSAYTEDWDPDTGGVLEVFVRNTGNEAATLSGIILNGAAPPSWPGVKWWRFWPEAVPPGGVATLTVKSVGAPLEPGSAVEVTVHSQEGQSASATVQCLDSRLRLGAALAAPDFRRIYLYARNDHSADIEVDAIRLNVEESTPAQPGRITALGGSWTVPAGGVRIFTAQWGAPLAPLTPMAIRILWREAGAPARDPACGGGMVRVTAPEYLLGTWSTDLRDYPGRTWEARALGINANLPGGQRYDTVRELWETAFLSHSLTYAAGSLTTETVQNAAPASGYHGWMLRDEPDMSPEDNPSPDLVQENQAIWRGDPNHPTWINLATTAAYSEYGTFTDIACMDHYAMFGAFTNIPGTWLIRVSDMEEALEWTRLLKQNIEPRPVWAWAQLAGSMWWGQPEPWGVNYQFWAHAMAGAKSVFWFSYGPGDQDNPDYAPAVAMAARIFRQAAPVRNLLYYGEPVEPRAVQPGSPLIARLLVGPEAAAAVVLNNNYQIGGTTPLQPVYERGAAEGWVEFALPDWLDTEEILRITETGSEPAEASVSDGILRLQVSLGPEETGVFTVGPKDRTAPEAVSRAIVTWKNDGAPGLHWAEPRDNRGVAQYEVLRNGQPLGTTPYPVWPLAPDTDWRDGFTVRAVDAAGNAGGFSPTARINCSDFPAAEWGMGWKAVSGASSQQTAAGGITAVSDGGTLRFQGPAMAMPASSAPRIRAIMELPAGASPRIEWQRTDAPTWDSARRITLTPWSGKSGPFSLFEADLSASGEWRDQISRVRLVVTGLQAGQEAALRLVHFAPEGLDADADGDALKDGEEYLLASDPFAADSDGDGLSDGDEVLVHGTDPTRADTDGDGLSDREELRWGSDPRDLLDTAQVPAGGAAAWLLLLLLPVLAGMLLSVPRRASARVRR